MACTIRRLPSCRMTTIPRSSDSLSRPGTSFRRGQGGTEPTVSPIADPFPTDGRAASMQRGCFWKILCPRALGACSCTECRTVGHAVWRSRNTFHGVPGYLKALHIVSSGWTNPISWVQCASSRFPGDHPRDEKGSRCASRIMLGTRYFLEVSVSIRMTNGTKNIKKPS